MQRRRFFKALAAVCAAPLSWPAVKSVYASVVGGKHWSNRIGPPDLRPLGEIVRDWEDSEYIPDEWLWGGQWFSVSGPNWRSAWKKEAKINAILLGYYTVFGMPEEIEVLPGIVLKATDVNREEAETVRHRIKISGHDFDPRCGVPDAIMEKVRARARNRKCSK